MPNCKKELRAQIRLAVAAMGNERKAAESSSVCRAVLGSPEWAVAERVLLYESMADEIDTRMLVEAAGVQGKEVLMPAQTWQEMLECGLESIGLALIPGRAFTKEGLRMGRGGGYYDRILDKLQCPCIGLAFSVQMVEDLPLDPWDRQLDEVIHG